MQCPYCHVDRDRVVDSRSRDQAATIRRRRECLSCERRFTTYERLEHAPLRVVKKDGTRVPFDRTKILSGILKACEKRPVPQVRIEEVVNGIEREITRRFDREVPSAEIGTLVMDALRHLDQVAYVRFASVYREFQDAQDFVEELKSVREGAPARGRRGSPGGSRGGVRRNGPGRGAS
ncbi:MAG: transcriptional repressor NrdR [Planctomycetes bacterium]|nr:transcriptional repressor NrdR [Planctomycetota bacterium]